MRPAVFFVLLFFSFSAFAQSPSPTPPPTSATQLAAINEQIAQQQKDIADVNKKITELSAKRNETAEEAAAIALAVEQLKAELVKAERELAKTKSTITKVQVSREQTTEEVQKVEDDIVQKKSELTVLIRQLYEHEGQSLMRIFFSSESLSDVLTQREEYKGLQEKAITVIEQMHDQEKELKEKQESLAQQEDDLGQLQTLLDSQADELAAKKSEQSTFLAQKKQEQGKFETLIAEAKAAREEISKRVFTLQSGAVNVSLNTANDMAKFAGSVTGVRPALIMAVLKIESNVGTNIGSGVFPDDMHPQSRDAFVRITKKLGLDITKAQISRRPRSMKGWGGAMGPAQIMPATWESIEGRIEQLTKKSPVNPYELSDAFVATAIFLADRGGATPGGEYEAVNRYIAGPNWQYYTWYGDKVMAVAKEYEAQGL